MKIVNWNSTLSILTVEMPNFNSDPAARDARLYGSVELWYEHSDEIQGIREEMRQKWSDAVIADLKEISADELMELMSVRGMELTIDS